ncbi:unnamed protein product [Arctogadus glacialis]
MCSGAGHAVCDARSRLDPRALGGATFAAPSQPPGATASGWWWWLGRELVNVAREREVWGPLLELLPPRPDPG